MNLTGRVTSSQELVFGFLVVGVFNTISVVTCVLMLDLILPVRLQVLSVAISNFLGLLQGHLLQRKFVWKSTASYIPELGRFFLGSLPSLVGAFVFYFVFTNSLGVNVALVQLIYSVFAASFSFIWNNKITFRRYG